MWPACGSVGASRAKVIRETGPTTVTANSPSSIRPSGVIFLPPPYCGALPTATSVAGMSSRTPSSSTVNGRGARRTISTMIARS